jgi:hypothetical protein
MNKTSYLQLIIEKKYVLDFDSITRDNQKMVDMFLNYVMNEISYIDQQNKNQPFGVSFEESDFQAAEMAAFTLITNGIFVNSRNKKIENVLDEK